MLSQDNSTHNEVNVSADTNVQYISEEELKNKVTTAFHVSLLLRSHFKNQ